MKLVFEDDSDFQKSSAPMSQVIDSLLEEKDQSTVISHLVCTVLSQKKHGKDLPSALQEAERSFREDRYKIEMIMERSKKFVGGQQIFYDRKDHLAHDQSEESDDNQS